MEFTSLDAIEFFQEDKKQARAYYQTTNDKAIRESSFDSGNGWFVRGSGIVTNDAKSKSPITVLRWNADKITEIRLYFLDDQNNIREAKGKHTGGITTWQSSITLKDASTTNIAEKSQLAVARPDKDDNTIRIFYQTKADANGNFPLRELKFYKGRHGEKWEVQTGQISGAKENTRLSAVSARPSGDVRLYYQGTDDLLLESFWNAREGKWTKVLHNDYKLVPRAPISALSWYVQEPKTDENLRVRIYTVLASKFTYISELSFENGWDSETDSVAELLASTSQPPEYSAVAASRDTKAEKASPIGVFYQPHANGNAIDLKPVKADEGDEYDTAAKAFVLPQGIPTSR